MTKVAIIGYGKMGKMIHDVVNRTTAVEVAAVIDNEKDWQQQEEALKLCHVAIEFSTPQAAYMNLMKCFELSIPVVCGTTGWYTQLEDVIAVAQQRALSLIYGSNFSIGANLFFKMNEVLAHYINTQPQYEVSIEETHHIAKLDMPSGTAVTIAQIIMQQLDRKNRWELGKEAETDTISITANRKGDIKGIHTVNYESDEDVITFTHMAKSRMAFARGAVKAALWLSKNAGVFNFKDIVDRV